MMPIGTISDWETRLARQDAFWHNAILDRPVVLMTHRKEKPIHAWPDERPYGSTRERWFDVERVVEEVLAQVFNTDYWGDALPSTFPNLGPEVFSAFFGMEMDYTRETSWSIPNLLDWAMADKLALSRDNVYWRKLEEMTNALLTACKGICYVGLTDFHPGGDALAAFRDPVNLNLDLLANCEDVKRLIKRIDTAYLETYDYWHEKLRAADQPCATWAGIVSSKKYYIPSNDFSCMISKELFDDVFLPGIAAECRHYEASIYHLDGPNALRHLDSLLEIRELNAIQWIYGAGQGRATDWIPVYKRCQEAGKGIQIWCDYDELDTIMAQLRPEGVWLSVYVEDKTQAETVLHKISAWI